MAHKLRIFPDPRREDYPARRRLDLYYGFLGVCSVHVHKDIEELVLSVGQTIGTQESRGQATVIPDDVGKVLKDLLREYNSAAKAKDQASYIGPGVTDSLLEDITMRLTDIRKRIEALKV